MPKLTTEVTTGLQIGRLTVLSEVARELRGGKNRKWWVKCSCGTEKQVYHCSLRSGEIKSCGCFQLEHRAKHGMSDSSTYNSWRGMLQRTTNPKNPSFPRYGGRGIGVCSEWMDFEAFFADMGVCPEGLSLERENTNGDYCKANCKWATDSEQVNNRRSSIRFEYQDRLWSIAELSKIALVSEACLYLRLTRHGYSVHEAITLPNRPRLKGNSPETRRKLYEAC